MTKADARIAANRALDALAASGRSITICPTRFAAPSQAGARLNPYRR